MKRVAAAMITLGFLAILIASAIRRENGGSPSSPDLTPDASRLDPSATIENLIESARKGNLTSYLSAFSDPLRQRFEREANERGREVFAEDLRRSAESRKSFAIFAVETDAENDARITVESVYADRNERQNYRLEKLGGRWYVAEVETSRSHQPLARFGAPAHYQAPEGAPVPGRIVPENSDNVGSP